MERQPHKRRRSASTTRPRLSSDHQAHHQQHDDRADHGIDDLGDEAAADVDANARQQPSAHHGADDADDDVADEPEAAPGHDLSREPAGNRADHEPNDDELYFWHRIFSPMAARLIRSMPSRAGGLLVSAAPGGFSQPPPFLGFC